MIIIRLLAILFIASSFGTATDSLMSLGFSDSVTNIILIFAIFIFGGVSVMAGDLKEH